MKLGTYITFIFCFFQSACNKTPSVLHYNFDYCKTCISRQDVIDYEQKNNSIAIPTLSDFEDIRIYENAYNTSDGRDTSHEWTWSNLYYLSFDSTLHCLIAKRYNFIDGYMIGKTSNDSILLSGIIVKYVSKDKYLDKFLNVSSQNLVFSDQLKAFAQSVKFQIDSITLLKASKYIPRNIESTSDFPLKKEMYGYIWVRPDIYFPYAINLELNYHLSDEVLKKELREVNIENNLAVYFTLDYNSGYLDSIKHKYNIPF